MGMTGGVKWVMRVVWGYAIAVLAAGLVGIVYLRGESRDWSPGFFVSSLAFVAAAIYGVRRGRKRKMGDGQSGNTN